MPGGLNSPMSTPQTQTQPGIDWSNVGAAANSSAPYTSGIEPDQTGGQTFTAGAAPLTPPASNLGGGTAALPDRGVNPDYWSGVLSDANQPMEGSRSYDLKPMFEGGGGGGFGSGGTESQSFGAPTAGSLGGNLFNYIQDPVAAKEPSAEDMAKQGRDRLAELLGDPKTAEETTKAVEDNKEATADPETIPLPRARPEGADAERPPADVAPQGLTYLQGKGPGDLKGVNQKFAKALQEFTKEYNASQGDYSIALRSGLRTGPKERFHGTGEAMDINLIDRRTGERLNDYQTRDPTVFKAYQDNANQFHSFLEKNYPDLAQMHRWGGYFSGGPGQYGASDIMHHDLAGRVGMGGGSWQGGLSQASADAYGLPTGGGTKTPWPQFTFDWSNAPNPDAPPIQQTYKSADGRSLYQLTEDGTRVPVPMDPKRMNETTEYDPFRGTQLGGVRERSGFNEGQDISPPPANIPDPRVSDGGFNALDAAANAPVKHSGLELARANIDTPIEQIAMERGGQKAVDQINSMAMGMTPRQLLQSYGGLFMSKAEPLFSSLGITRQDFDKAVAMPQTRQDLKMRFAEGGGFGPYPAYTGPEEAPGSQRFNYENNVWEKAPDSWADFRRSGNIDDQRGLPAEAPGVLDPVKNWASDFWANYGPQADPGPLGRDAGINELSSNVSAAPRFMGGGNANDDSWTPQERTDKWNTEVYNPLQGPVQHRDEGAIESRWSNLPGRPEDVIDRRFDPALTGKQEDALRNRGPGVPNGSYIENAADRRPIEGGELGRWGGTEDITNLERASLARQLGQGVGAAPRAAGDGDSYDNIFAANDAAASDAATVDERFGPFGATSMRDFPSPANDYSAFQQPASRDALAKTMDFSGGFSPSPEPRKGGVGPQAELTPDFMDVIKEVESSGDPNQVTGSYKGLYQLDDKEFRKYGGQGDIFDPEENTKAASAKMIDENQRVQDRLGRALTPARAVHGASARRCRGPGAPRQSRSDRLEEFPRALQDGATREPKRLSGKT